jgi:hypothetical protein
MAEMILARVQRCRHCRREMSSSPLAYEQNPFCTECLSERVSSVAPRGGVSWRREGHYVIAEVARKHPSDVHKRRLR